MGIEGLNNFGNLTTQNGKRLTFKDFDLDNDGQISEEEFNTVLKQNKIDTVELSSIDNNNDKYITQEEFALMEMNADANDYYTRIINIMTRELVGSNKKYTFEIADKLKVFSEDYLNKVTANNEPFIGRNFANALNRYYETLKEEIVWNNPEAIKSRALDEMYASLNKSLNYVPDDVKEDVIKELVSKLDVLAEEFIKTNKEPYSIQSYLRSCLSDMMNTTDASRMQEEVKEYRSFYCSLGGYKDDGDFEALKNIAADFIKAALDKGIKVELQGVKLSTEAQIKDVLAKYNSAEELNSDVENLIKSFSQEYPIDVLIRNIRTESDERITQNLKGEDCNIPDYGYYNSWRYAGFTVTTLPKTEENKDKLQIANERFERLLLNNQVKFRVKDVFYQQLKDKGIYDTQKFEELFDKVYSQSVRDCLTNLDDKVLQSIADYLKGGHNIIEVNPLLESFIDNFNKNITIAINNINNPEPDFNDIDYSMLVSDENGTIDEEMLEKLENGSSVYGTSDDVTEKLGKMIDKLKPSLISKSMVLCKRNGVAFDNSVVTKIFNKSKLAAMNNSMIDLFFICIAKPQQILTNFTVTYESNYKEWIESEKLKDNSF